MYIDSGKDLKVDKITSPRPDKIGLDGNSRTQLNVKQSNIVKKQVKGMKTNGPFTSKGEKYA